jgi:predicted AlkP superfamily phosphohydrolase/phosphomutase
MAETANNRVIFIGIDGLDANLAEHWIDRGYLPYLSKIADQGDIHRLTPLSPVQHGSAWASFLTGVNPARHRVFALPSLDGARRRAQLNELFAIPRRMGKAYLAPLLERDYFFANFERGIYPVLIGFPHTFPPPGIKGHILSGYLPTGFPQLTTPVLLTDRIQGSDLLSGGLMQGVQVAENRVEVRLAGGNFTSARVRITLEPDKQRAVARFGRRTVELPVGQLSRPLTVTFTGSVRRPRRGLVRFLLASITPHLSIFIPGIVPHPLDFPYSLSTPRFYAARALRVLGDLPLLDPRLSASAYASGMLDLSGISQVLEQSLRQSAELFLRALSGDLLHYHWRESRLLAMNTGVIDALEHILLRHLRPRSEKPANPQGRLLLAFYRLVDSLIGRVQERMRKGDILLVAGDCGQRPTEYAVSLNRHFLQQGLLSLQEGADVGEPGLENFWEQLDWGKTLAYSLGGGAVFLNRWARDYHPGRRSEEILATVCEGLRGLRHNGSAVVKNITYGRDIFSGEYFSQAPDLLVDFVPGFACGYQDAECLSREVFTENDGEWSGEHFSLHPRSVESVLISNRSWARKPETLLDLPPTIAAVLGQEPSPDWEGENLLAEPSSVSSPSRET